MVSVVKYRFMPPFLALHSRYIGLASVHHTLHGRGRQNWNWAGLGNRVENGFGALQHGNYVLCFLALGETNWVYEKSCRRPDRQMDDLLR